MSLILVAALAACGGGDDDDDPTATSGPGATPTATTAATATETESTAGAGEESSPDASPTLTAVPASPTAQATAPTRPIATTPPTQPAPTAPTEEDPDAALEEALLEALLQPADFSADWTQDAFGPMEPDTDDSDELCGQPPFPDRDQRIAGVEAEYSLEVDPPASVIENIVAFPEETAIAAMDYAREVSACGGWTDEDGLVFTITPFDGPDYGDDTFSAVLTIESQGTLIYGEYNFIRVGGVIATVAFITLDGEDVTSYQALVGVAAERLDEAFGEIGGAGAGLADVLLLPEDIALVDSVRVWEVGNPIRSTDESRFSVCESASFPDALGAVEEVGHGLFSDDAVGTRAMHSVVQLAAGDGVAAMEWIRAESSCSTWSNATRDFEVAERGDLDVGEDTHWLIVDVTATDSSGLVAQVAYGFTQIGDTISVVGLVAEGDIDPELFGAVIALAAEKVFAGMP